MDISATNTMILHPDFTKTFFDQEFYVGFSRKHYSTYISTNAFSPIDAEQLSSKVATLFRSVDVKSIPITSDNSRYVVSFTIRMVDEQT